MPIVEEVVKGDLVLFDKSCHLRWQVGEYKINHSPLLVKITTVPVEDVSFEEA